MNKINISPKKKKNNVMLGQSLWYNYYAGYSDEFVYKLLKKYTLSLDNPKILDPWTGSGTTNLVANYLGYVNYGFDINPVMVIISKAKQYNAELIDRELLSSVLNTDSLKKRKGVKVEQDFLLTWFTEKSVRLIRRFEYLIQVEILKYSEAISINIRGVDSLTADISFYYMALFHTVKSFTTILTGSNPTWVKTTNIQNKIEINVTEFLDEFFRYILNAKENFVPLKSQNSCIELLDSKVIDRLKNEIDVIVTSPPYCTRIDYVVSTIIELAIIGFKELKINELRKSMIGTPKVTCNNLNLDGFNFNSTTTNSVLKKIKEHNSKAAKTYYYKTYFQYFYDMQQSIERIDNIMKPQGIVIFVVQDSYFKDVNVNLSKCIAEMFIHLGYEVIKTQSYLVSNNLRYINSKSRKYKKTTETRERLIVLRKGNSNE